MLKLFSIALFAGAFGLSTVEVAHASGNRCCAQQSCAPTSCVPSCAPAMAPARMPAGHGDHAVPMPPAAAPQADAGTYQRFSYDPAMPAPAYRGVAPSYRNAAPSYRPSYMRLKTDPRKYSVD